MIIHLPKGNAKTIYSALIDCLKQKNFRVKKIVCMGFDGANTFSGNKNGVQAKLKKLAPHALFVHCHCHMLRLACVQAANETTGIKHVYVTLTIYFYFYFYFLKEKKVKVYGNFFTTPQREPNRVKRFNMFLTCLN